MESSKSLNVLTLYRMSPPAPCPGFFPAAVKTFMAWSSMAQLAGIAVPLHCRQPSKVRPSNRRIHPCFFSESVSVFGDCDRRTAPSARTTTRDQAARRARCFICHSPSDVSLPGSIPAQPVRAEPGAYGRFLTPIASSISLIVRGIPAVRFSQPVSVITTVSSTRTPRSSPATSCTARWRRPCPAFSTLRASADVVGRHADEVAEPAPHPLEVVLGEVEPLLRQDLLDLLAALLQRQAGPVDLQVGLVDGQGGLVDLALARRERAVGRERRRDVDVVVVEVRPGVDDDEIAVLQPTVVAVVVDVRMVLAGRDDDAVRALLRPFLLADVVELRPTARTRTARVGWP